MHQGPESLFHCKSGSEGGLAHQSWVWFQILLHLCCDIIESLGKCVPIFVGKKTKPTHSHETGVYQCINPAQPVQWLLCLTLEPEIQKPLFNFVLQLVSVEVWIISSLCLVWAAQWEPAQGRSCCCFIGSAWGGEKSEDGPDWANPTSPSPKAPKPTGKIYLLPRIQGYIDEGFFSF